MNDSKSDAVSRFQRLAPWGLVLVAAIALLLTLRSLSVANAERARLVAWQSGILHQLKMARQAGDRAAPAVPVTAEKAPEILADVIGARDVAQAMLEAQMPYARADAPKQAEAPILPRSRDAPRPDSIKKLLVRGSAGIAGDDVAAIDQDSQAPWVGWK